MMNTENDTQPSGGGQPVPAAEAHATPAPKMDAVAPLETPAETPPAVQTPPATAEEEQAEKKRNKTREYIERQRSDKERALNENRELKARLKALEDRLPAAPAPTEPKPEDFNFDMAAFAKAHADYAVQQALEQRDAQSKTQAEQGKQEEVLRSYQQRAAAFAEQNDDFLEVVGSIPPEMLPPELQVVILGLENGPEVAYRLAQDEDALFQLAGTRPELMQRAVARYASRLSAAPAASAAPAPQKSITQAPAPAPRLGGRVPVETPPDKLTDEEWFKQRGNKT